MAELAHIFRWDLDKTYLRTDFETFRGLWRSAVERADQKQAVPGASALLRELRRSGPNRICFISGSPRQMRRVLVQKLKLDGVEFDEFILKPNMSNLFRGRFRALREQVGYKLPALLAGRAGVPSSVPETLFGDDAEGDAFIYSLYADIVRGAVAEDVVGEVLRRVGVYPDVLEHTLELIASLPKGDAVQRIFIHLDKRSPPARFDRYGSRLVPFYNYLQAAAILYQDELLDAESFVRVALDMVERSGYQAAALANAYQELVRRGSLLPETGGRLAAELEFGELPSALGAEGERARSIVEELGRRLRALGEATQPADPPAPIIDYLVALEEDPPRKQKAKKAAAEGSE